MIDDIQKAAGIIIVDRKLLVEKSYGKSFYISPGGTVEEGESNEEALIRELEEEFTIKTTKFDLKFFGAFEAEAANNPGHWVKMAVFMVNGWTGDIKPSSEVEKIAWIISENTEELPLGSIFEHQVVPKLKSQGLID